MNQLDGSKLRVCNSYLRQERNRVVMRESRIILLEHLLPTTEELINGLREAGAEIFRVLGKPYSVDPRVQERLIGAGHRVEVRPYKELEEGTFLSELIEEAVAASENDGRKIVFVDVGGYFAHPLLHMNPAHARHIAGVVEDTTFGHNRYLEAAGETRVPVLSVARSHLKEIEAHFVGRDAVHAVEGVLREIGVSMTGRHAVVIGYGMVGKHVARSLKANDLNVSVYDIRDHRNLSAFMMGFDVDKKARLLQGADLVFAATGWSTSLAVVDPESEIPTRVPALSQQDILENLKHNAILASVGSQDNEFDIRAVQELADDPPVAFGPYLKQYHLPDGDAVYVIKDGTAVNFIEPSIPVEVLDLVFSEIVLGLIFLLKTPEKYPPGQVHSTPEKYLSYIAKDWLRYANPRR